MSSDINERVVNVERNEKILKKCLEIYDRSRSVRFVEKFYDRLDFEYGNFQLYDLVMTNIQRRYLPNFTVGGFVEECLNLYRERHSLEGIYELARSETPLTEDDYREWETSFSDLVQKEPNPPTNEQWSCLGDSLLQ
jgi:hypothetical protein